MGVLSNIRDSIAQHDPHGQAPQKAIRASAVQDRSVDELIGIIKGVLADGQVATAEARFLLDWMTMNSPARNVWPANVIYPRLLHALHDDQLDSKEESELLSLLAATVGGNAAERGEGSMSTTLPLSEPEPPIHFEGQAFCFTGKFYSGTRDWCEGQVIARGGEIVGISKKLDLLVIGEIGSRDWIHSTHGRKIEKAVELRDAGTRLAIVCEKHWHSHLG